MLSFTFAFSHQLIGIPQELFNGSLYVSNHGYLDRSARIIVFAEDIFERLKAEEPQKDKTSFVQSMLKIGPSAATIGVAQTCFEIDG